MRYHEIASGIRVHTSLEEQEIIDKIGEGSIKKSDLSEREQEVARLMVSHGLLDRFKIDNTIMFRVSSIGNVWRGRDE